LGVLLGNSDAFKGTGDFRWTFDFGPCQASGKWTAKLRAGENRRKFGL
jgi:hypothetical protein